MPKYSTRNDIARFLVMSKGGLGRFIPFISSISVEKCEILRLEDRQARTVEYHGLITAGPDKACTSLIEKFNAGLFNGQQVEVRPFIKRSIYKDRRKLHADLELLPRERRSHDRRRPSLHLYTLKCRSESP